uniref:Uncharacterized protein n=1 Tax=Pseudopediastrum boryanum TaxID=55410 RepID=A0A2U8GJ50_PSEBY|nr:hypothetical protein [Pseudopediastrum boryanum]AWI68659.1 hypothetical protein [Pseudopediastrum boryanum]
MRCFGCALGSAEAPSARGEAAKEQRGRCIPFALSLALLRSFFASSLCEKEAKTGSSFAEQRCIAFALALRSFAERRCIAFARAERAKAGGKAKVEGVSKSKLNNYFVNL